MNSNRVCLDIEEIINEFQGLNQLKSKAVLVTGATGFIGSMLVRTLLEANKQKNLNISVIGLVRDIVKFNNMFPDVIDSIKLVTSYDEISEADYIIHTISPTTSKYFVTKPIETIEANYINTIEVLELAKKLNSSVVYLSSMEQYGNPYIKGEVMTEDKVGIINHLDVRSSYSESKRLCECLCVSYYKEYGVNVMIARLAQTFGAGAPLTDNRMPMQFARSVKNRENIILHTEGKSFSNVVYITDAITGLLTILVNGVPGEAYNICNDKETKDVKSIANIVCEEVSKGSIRVETQIQTNLGFAPDVCLFLNSDKLSNLGWQPKVGLSEGYERLVEYLIECE